MGKRVLLVDNSVPLSQSVKFTLSREGYEVALVEDEEVAIKKLSTEIYDVVILDLKMQTNTDPPCCVFYKTGKEKFLFLL